MITFFFVKSFPKKAVLLPSFENFPVAEEDVFRGTPAPVNFSSMPEALHYKTVITEGAKRGPNFAGHYTIVTWGCGSPCQISAVVDAITGNIVAYAGDSLSTGYGVKYKINSKMLVVDDPGESLKNFAKENTRMLFPTRYLVMENSELKLIGEYDLLTGKNWKE